MLPRLTLPSFGRPVENWKMGGTIATQQSPTGTRLPSRQAEKASSHGEVRYMLEYPVDSSSLTPALQARPLNLLLSDTFTSTNKAHPKRLPLAEIPLHFSYPPALGAGVVLSHGTDTLAETAALIGYLNPQRVVVVTGSFASPDEQGSDASLNLKRSELLAQNDATPPGVYVVIGDDIHLATRLVKVNTHPWDARHPESHGKEPYFASVDNQPIGQINRNNKISLNSEFLEQWQLHWQHPTSALKGEPLTVEPAYVERLTMSLHTPMLQWQQFIQRLTQQPVPCGAVIEGELLHHPQWQQLKNDIEALQGEHRFIVLTSDLNAQAAPGSTLTAAQCRTKLSAILGRVSD